MFLFIVQVSSIGCPSSGLDVQVSSFGCPNSGTGLFTILLKVSYLAGSVSLRTKEGVIAQARGEAGFRPLR
jgi:hypothetical protein